MPRSNCRKAREFECTEDKFFSKHFLKGEVLDLEEAGNLLEEIEMMRVVTRRLLKMARACKDIGELANVLNTLGQASTRVAGLMRTQKFLCGNRDRLDEFLDRARDEVLKEWGGFRYYQIRTVNA
jgi:hypothetical protein